MKMRTLYLLLTVLLCSGCVAVPYYYDAPYSGYSSPSFYYSPSTTYWGPDTYAAPVWPYAYAWPSFSFSYWNGGHSHYRGHHRYPRHRGHRH
jgi:hypothetical protein